MPNKGFDSHDHIRESKKVCPPFINPKNANAFFGIIISTEKRKRPEKSGRFYSFMHWEFLSLSSHQSEFSLGQGFCAIPPFDS